MLSISHYQDSRAESTFMCTSGSEVEAILYLASLHFLAQQQVVYQDPELPIALL